MTAAAGVAATARGVESSGPIEKASVAATATATSRRLLRPSQIAVERLSLVARPACRGIRTSGVPAHQDSSA